MLIIDDVHFRWSKTDDVPLSQHFRSREFTCPCIYDDCFAQFISVKLLNKLEVLKGTYNGPIHVNSGFRCKRHQDDLRAQGLETSKGRSQHEAGEAADLKAIDQDKLVEEATKIFTTYGIAKTFIHVDTRVGPIIWSYKK